MIFQVGIGKTSLFLINAAGIAAVVYSDSIARGARPLRKPSSLYILLCGCPFPPSQCQDCGSVQGLLGVMHFMQELPLLCGAERSMIDFAKVRLFFFGCSLCAMVSLSFGPSIVWVAISLREVKAMHTHQSQ